MANVLPLERQRKVWAMYRARFLIVCSLLLLVLALVAGLVTVPSYLALRIDAPERTVANASKPDSSDAIAIARTQSLVSTLLPLLSATSSASFAITRALEEKPVGVKVERISYARGEISLSGTASRDALNTYRNSLVQSGAFTGVSLPVGALVISEGSRFTIKLSGNF